LIAYTPEALQQVDDLIEHYEERERTEAVHSLLAALDEAGQKIESNPGAGLAAPRPYPQLARTGRAWIKAGRYWIAYSVTRPPSITAVFFETSDIPGRV
jgi:plasmid stabilization system protein ParE